MAQRQNNRIPSYELLRVIAMFMVVLLHYNVQSGGLMNAGDPVTPVGIAASILEALCICAVNVYVLITGYFMCEAQYKVRRLVRLWLEIACYTIGIPAVLTVLTVPVNGSQGLWQMARYVFPISMEHYWFATAYCLLYLLVPVLNRAVHALTRRQLKGVIIGLLLFTCVIKSISPVELATDRYGYDVLWFVVLYLIAAYIRLYDVPRFNHPAKAAATYGVSCALIAVLTIALHAYTFRTGRLTYYAGVPLHYNSLLTLTAAIGLFYLFKFVHLEESGVLAACARAIAPYTLGVYLIHEHIDIRDRWVPGFGVILGREISTNPIEYVIQALAYALMLYVICVIIDMVRATLFRVIGARMRGSWVDRAIDKVDSLYR